MSRIFITGSADGLGHLSAKALIAAGHEVVLHARNVERAKDAMAKLPEAKAVLTGDLSSMDETKALAAKVNELGRFDAVIHNAGVYRLPPKSISVDGLPVLLAVNTLAPYILTCLVKRPERLVYLSSGMHLQGHPDLDITGNGTESLDHRVTYSDTKLHDVILTLTIARLWQDVYANAVDPGWVPTRMGGAHAPGDLQKGFETQVWLATSDDAEARVTGRYFHHKKTRQFLPAAGDPDVQEKFLALCAGITGVELKGSKRSDTPISNT